MRNSFFSRFAPKEPKFFPWLKELSDIAIGTSELLIDNLQKDTADERAACYKLIKELERKADVLANHVTDELSTTFITPFDREDIHELTAAIDDVVDGINSCSKCILIYHPCTIDESGKKLANYIRQAAQCIRRAMDELERIGKKLICCGSVVRNFMIWRMRQMKFLKCLFITFFNKNRMLLKPSNSKKS